MFSDPDLTRTCPPLKIRDFLKQSDACGGELNTQNVFEPIARRDSAVEHAFQLLSQHVPVRLTGSGSALFAACESKQEAEKIAQVCGEKYTTYVVKGLNQSPVISRSAYN